ncbi:MAG: 4-(cytidine 5'-diphospho)-2-C-methyl-D-erythritol kinase [Sumerlaeia bacterium]
MIRLQAPAKINLTLDILGKREDGFHDLVSVFQAVSLADELAIEATPESGRDLLEVSGPFAEGIPTDGSNLVLKAVAKLREGVAASAHSLRLRLVKNVPSGAGLGGGSSDAVAALLGASRIWGLKAGAGALASLAAQVGSDCPFFLRGGTQLAGGRGERLEPLLRQREFGILIVVPDISVGTREAYARLDPAQDFGERTNPAALLDWLSSFKTDKPPKLHNAFQRSCAEAHTEVRDTLAELERVGAHSVALSGSGSACFGLFLTARQARLAAKEWRLPARLVRPCEPADHGVRIIE